HSRLLRRDGHRARRRATEVAAITFCTIPPVVTEVSLNIRVVTVLVASSLTDARCGRRATRCAGRSAIPTRAADPSEVGAVALGRLVEDLDGVQAVRVLVGGVVPVERGALGQRPGLAQLERGLQALEVRDL